MKKKQKKLKYTKAEAAFYTTVIYGMLRGIGRVIFAIAFLILVIGVVKWLL